MSNQEIEVLRQFLAAAPNTDQMSLDERRAFFDSLSEQFPTPADVVVERADANGVRAEWVRAAGARPDSVVLYLHGGGYIVGSPLSHRHLVAELGRAAEAAALSLDYRLAPEHPFPAAVEDAVTAYAWLLDQGISPNRIVIAGDSAGGGLTVATMLLLRDRGIALPAGGVCISPWADLTISAESYKTKADVDPMLNKDQLMMMAAAYLAGADPRSPLASPIFADLKGLSPLLIQVGTDEIILDDSLVLAERAKEAGVACTLEVSEEMIHVWHFFYPLVRQGREAIARIGEFVRKEFQIKPDVYRQPI
jgi:acetyl esterase/lipase